MLRNTLTVCALCATLLIVCCFAPVPAHAATLDQDDLAAIEQIVEKGVAKRLAPVNRTLAMMQDDGVTPTEVAGGIGYIVGIGGLLAWGASRRKRD
jgi:nickel transport protein